MLRGGLQACLKVGFKDYACPRKYAKLVNSFSCAHWHSWAKAAFNELSIIISFWFLGVSFWIFASFAFHTYWYTVQCVAPKRV